MYIKIFPSILMFLCCALVSGQESSEIYLFDLEEKDSIISISNPINISNSAGYDNQPSFTEDGTGILFCSFRNGQADVAKYFIDEKYRVWITNTEANEFSPMSYPGKKKNFTCVRLNEDETQLLYKYTYKNKPAEIMIPNATVGYYLWFNEKTLISYVIGDTETLQVSNLKYKIKYPIQKNIGRSIQKIPLTASLGDQLISYISLEHEVPEIYSINPIDSTAKYITDALEGSQDLVWTKNGCMLMGKEGMIYKFCPDKDKTWCPISIECDLPLDGISRIAISPDGSKIAVVVSE